MKFEIPDDRSRLVPSYAAQEEYIQCFPWAIAEDYAWDWADMCPFDKAIYESVDGNDPTPIREELMRKYDIHADYDAIHLALAPVADSVLRYVLENPHYYGLKKIESEEEQP